MAKAVIGEMSEVEVTYSRPFFSENVRLVVTGTKNVELPTEELTLEERDGTLTIPYQLTGTGFDQLTLKVSGEHKGKVVTETRRIYLRASKPAQTAEPQQVSQS